MTDVYVSALSYALGEHSFSVEEAKARETTLSSTQVLLDAGFRRHHVCGSGTTAYELALRSVEPLRPHLEGTAAIVYATCLPLNGNMGLPGAFDDTRDVKHLMDFPASRLQSRLGLPNAIVVGLNQQACTGMLGSIRIAHGLLSTEVDFEQVLCVTADRFPEGACYEQAYNLISDGGAACIVSKRRAGFRLVTCHQITNGALTQATDDESVGTYFNYTNRLITETLERAHLRVEDLDWVVPQNMNVKAWHILGRFLKLDPARIYFDPLPEVAHVISGDCIINLKHLDDSGRVLAGQRLLLLMAGFGLNWQAVILEKVESQ